MRKFTIVFGGLVIVLAISFGISQASKLSENRSHVKNGNKAQQEDFAKAEELLNEGKAEDALPIIYKYQKEIESRSKEGMEWLSLFIDAAQKTKDTPQLAALFEFFPEIFKGHENASLLVANYYILNNQLKNYKKVRSLWKDRETKVAPWFVLDADKLLLEGKRQQALAFLKSKSFKNKADVERLVRLALLQKDVNPKNAEKLLSKAHAKDLRNADVILYRAKLLESEGKASSAEKEFLAAIRLDPKNIYLKEQLADFYLKQKDYPQALDVLKEELSPPSLDTIWIKALFWEKITTPLSFNWELTPPPQGKLEPFVQYLISLKKDAFWNEEEFSLIPNNSYYLKTLQETFWLKLLNALQNENQKKALALLEFNPFRPTSWDLELETALQRILYYRMQATLDTGKHLLALPDLLNAFEKRKHLPPLFKELEKLAVAKEPEKMPEGLHRLLVSNEAFSAALLSVNWYEAGLLLHQLPVIPDDFPNWVAYNLTNAIYHNRSLADALEFASLQKQTPDLTLLVAELQIKGGDPDAALEKLNMLAKSDSDVGFKAAWLASLIFIDKKEWGNAIHTIYLQPRLANDILGKETLARIAYLEGDIPLADRLYKAIEKSSPEARSYLARKAYLDKNWKRAKELTEQLIKDYPDNATLQENLIKINKEKEKSRS